tara:strand:- start:1610 stop:2371 length:762 start_codon:yes stop_codon:yes gene_type:complete
MAKQTINIGSSANDGSGTTIRAGGDLINDNFNEIYTAFGTGSALSTTAFTIVDESSTESTISYGERLAISGGTNLTSTVSGDSVNITLNTTVTGLTSVQTETLTNASGNLLVSSATNITEFRGDGSSIEGQIKLNCHANSHGQTIKPQPHSASVTNTMLLPQGGNSTLVSEIATQTLTNKTIGVGQLTCITRAYTGDGSTVAFTVTSGMTVNNVLVFLNGVFQRPTTDYAVSGTTLTFGTAPVSADNILIKEL